MFELNKGTNYFGSPHHFSEKFEGKEKIRKNLKRKATASNTDPLISATKHAAYKAQETGLVKLIIRPEIKRKIRKNLWILYVINYEIL